MSSDANPHEEFEIAALRRARGALDADGVARLDAHLASCAACRGFAATAEATESALRVRGVGAASRRALPNVREVADRRARSMLLRAGTGVGAWAAITALDIWLRGFAPVAVPAVIGAAVVAGGVGFLLLPRLRRLRDSASGTDDLFAALRDDLDCEISRLRRLRFAGCALAVLAVASFAHAATAMAEGRHQDVHVVQVVASSVLLVWLWRRMLVDLPNLERERRELGT